WVDQSLRRTPLILGIHPCISREHCWFTLLAFARCKRDEKSLVHSHTAVPQRLGVTHE
ncbi:unnamed protein product, partial [Ectocarpus sp. 6 AP-2014]